MHTIFIFILCTALTFTDINAWLDQAIGNIPDISLLTAKIVVGGSGVLYLIKSNVDKAKQLKLLSQRIAEVEEAAQNVLRTYDGAAQICYEFGFIAGRNNNTSIFASFNRLKTYAKLNGFLQQHLPKHKPILPQ